MTLPDNIAFSVQQALQEDVGTGDVTADLIAQDTQSEATVICREDAVLSGVAWFNEVFNQIDANITIEWHFKDGDRVPADSILCNLSGNSRALLICKTCRRY